MKVQTFLHWGLFFISFMSFMFVSFIFMLHESPPQQQHSCLSDAVAPFFIAPSFIPHESPQQPEDMQQPDSIFLLASVCDTFCARPTPAIAIHCPSTRPRANPLRFFIFISPERK